MKLRAVAMAETVERRGGGEATGGRDGGVARAKLRVARAKLWAAVTAGAGLSAKSAASPPTPAISTEFRYTPPLFRQSPTVCSLDDGASWIGTWAVGGWHEEGEPPYLPCEGFGLEDL